MLLSNPSTWRPADREIQALHLSTAISSHSTSVCTLCPVSNGKCTCRYHTVHSGEINGTTLAHHNQQMDRRSKFTRHATLSAHKASRASHAHTRSRCAYYRNPTRSLGFYRTGRRYGTIVPLSNSPTERVVISFTVLECNYFC